MVAIPVTRSISIDSDEIEESFTRSSGPGGQHVNTTDSAVQLRFDVWGSPSLPDMVKHRLTDMAGSRITKDGILILRSEGARSQLLNREEVRERLFAMIRGYRRHQVTLPLLLAAPGLGLLLLGVTYAEHYSVILHSVLVTCGGLLVASAHFVNLRRDSRHNDDHVHGPQCAH